MNTRKDVDYLLEKLIERINPYQVVKDNLICKKNAIVISIGKAAWTMAKAASDVLQDNVKQGVVIIKYKHSKGKIANFKIFEAGHPVLDENSIKATEYVLDITANLTKDDNVIFLVSGGGSALFESPLISLQELQDINSKLLKSGANINEINTIRKRLSNVKAGRFASHCMPANIDAYLLSDVLGNDLGTIASGPAAIDINTCADAFDIVNKYDLQLSAEVKKLLSIETVKQISNVTNHFVGSVDLLCANAKQILQELGYECKDMNQNFAGYVDELSSEVCKLAKDMQNSKKSVAFIYGGESLVNVKGNGLGGRNQQFALACAKDLRVLKDTCVLGFGSDGTDGPTDAAGGYVDENTYDLIPGYEDYLNNNDSYYALQKANGLIITGPTGTNVNDLYLLLIKR